MMRGLLIALLAAATMSCARGPVPSGVYLSLSVSAGDVAVETSVNGKVNEFLSGASGNMVASGPINASVKEGANEISFRISRGDEVGDEYQPSFQAALEIAVKGEIIDTSEPGDRVIFQRDLSEAEMQSLLAGEDVVVTETFDVAPDRLKQIKSLAEIGPPPEPSTGH